MITALIFVASLTSQSRPPKLEKVHWLRRYSCDRMSLVGNNVCASGDIVDEYTGLELMTKSGKHIRSLLGRFSEIFVGGANGLVYSSSNGSIHISTDRGKELRHFGSFGNHADQFTKGGKVWWEDYEDGPQYMAVGPTGDVYAYDQGSRSIKHFSDKGRFLGVVKPNILSDVNVFDLAVDSLDNVYAACQSDKPQGFVVCISPSGKVLRTFGSIGEGVGRFYLEENAASGPSAVAVGPDGLIYVADENGGKVEVFSSSGQPLKTLKFARRDDGMLIYNIAIDKSGTLFVGSRYGLFSRKKR